MLARLHSVDPVQPSSLIFVLVVGIWAVYLLGHWIKRRDHLATVRTADRFSDAMRVLGERGMQQQADPGPSRSHSLVPTRAARPASATPAPETDEGEETRGPRASFRPSFRPGEVSRRTRGLTFLGATALLPVILLAAAFGPLPWPAPALWLLAVGGSFVWLRRCVVRERTAARKQGDAPAPAARPRRQPREAAEPQRPVARSAREEEPREAPRRRSQFYDITEDEPAAAEPAPQAEPEPGTWQPTPVPRPTYTMKARADRAPVTPSVPQQHPLPAASGEVPQVIDVEDEELPALVGWR